MPSGQPDPDIAELDRISHRFSRLMELDPVITEDEFRSASELADPPMRVALAVCLTTISNSIPKEFTYQVLQQLSQYLPGIERRILGPVAALGVAIESKRGQLGALGPDTRGKSSEELEAIAKSMDPSTVASLNSILDDIAEAAKGADPAVLEKCKQESRTALATYKTLYAHLEEKVRGSGKSGREANGARTPTHTGGQHAPRSGCLLSLLAFLGAAALGMLMAR